MRKTLLTMLLVVLVTVASVAQQSNSVKITNDVVRQGITRTDVMANRAYLKDVEQNISQPSGQVVSQRASAAGAVKIGTAPHIFTQLSERCTSVDSNPEMNAVSFIHRNSDDGFTSSQYRFDISTDGGETFTSNIGPVNPNTPGANVPNGQGRYPQGIMFTPEDSDDSYMIYAGATHDGVSGTVWDGFVSGSARLDGSEVTQVDNLIPDGVIPTSLVEGLSGEFWSVDMFVDDAGVQGDLAIHKGTWNGAGVDWSTTLVPASTFQDDDGPVAANPVIDFSDDGMTGYLVVSGGLAGDDENIAYNPLFWITDDGGANWIGPNTMNLDKIGGYADTFSYSHNGNVPEGDIVGPLTTSFANSDIVVDANGDLHIGCLLQSVFYDTAEGDFTPFSIGSNGNFIVDLHFDRAGNTWNMIWPDPNSAGLAQIVKSADTIIFDGTHVSDIRLHISTDAAREKVFISWGDDLDNLGAGEEAHRDLYAFGYDVTTNKTTDVRNMTGDNEEWYGKAFFASIAPKTLGGNGVYTLPSVFAEISDPNDQLAPIQFWYYQEASFEEGDFAFDPAVPSTGAVAYSGSVPVIGEIEATEITEPYDYGFSLPQADASTLKNEEVTWYFGDGSAPEVAAVDAPVGHTFPDGSFVVRVCGNNEDGFVCATTSISTVNDETAPEVTVSYDGEEYGDGDEITVAGGELADILTVTVTDEIDPSPSVEIDGGDYDPAVPGSYDVTITGTDASGNATTITITVVIVDEEAPSITVSDGTDTIEDGGSVSIEGGFDVVLEEVLTITADDNSGDVTPDYDVDAVDFTMVGDYDLEITATDASGNTTTSTITVTVTDTSNPVLDLAVSDEVTDYDCGNQTFTPAPDDFADLLTLEDNLIESGANLNDYVEFSENIGTDNGTYSVEYTATDDAGNVSDPVTIDFIINCPTGIEDIALAAAISVTPNPSTGLFQVIVEDSYNQVDITVVDVQGKEILRSTAVTGTINLDLTDVATGIYFVQVSTEDAVAVKKVIVE